MKKKKMFFLDLLIAAVLVGIDQFTKYLAVLFLKGQEPFVIIPGALELKYLENRGAAFGILQGQKLFFVVMTLLILCACLYALWRMPAQKKYAVLHVLGGVLMAGALGNFIDRIRLDYVVDFIYISLIDFPIFNVADMYVTFICIAGLLLVFFGHMKEEDFDFLSLKKSEKKEK